MQSRYVAGAYRPSSLALRKEARAFAERLQALLARGIGKDLTVAQLLETYEMGLTGYINPQPQPPPELTIRQLLGIDPLPPDTSEPNTLLGRMERDHLITANAEQSSENVAGQIMAIGRQFNSGVFPEPEPPSSTSKRGRRH